MRWFRRQLADEIFSHLFRVGRPLDVMWERLNQLKNESKWKYSGKDIIEKEASDGSAKAATMAHSQYMRCGFSLILFVSIFRPHDLKNVYLTYYLFHCRHYEQETIDLTSTLQWYFALFVCIVLTLNVVSGMFFYVKRTKYDASVVLSPQQRKILNVKNDGNFIFINANIS